MAETPSVDPTKSVKSAVDPTSKVLDKGLNKVIGPKEGDSENKAAAKEAISGIAKGATQGAATGGAHGAVLGAVKGLGETAMTNKKVRNGLIVLLVLLMLPQLMLGGMMMMMAVSVTAAMTSEMSFEVNGTKAAAENSKLDESQTDAIRRASDVTSAQWPVLFALYTVAQQSSSMSAGAPMESGTDPGTAPLTGGGGLDLGTGCAPWATKVASYLHKNWPESDGGAGTIGCQRDDSDSDHNSGNALDWMIVPTKESALGKEVASVLMKNAKALDIKYLIFEQHIWNPSRDAYGKWRPMSDRGTVSANHYDHIHISFNGGTGTFDTESAKPAVTPEEVAAAFGGAGSGGSVEGYEDYSSSGTSTSDAPFGILPDAEGAPDAGDYPDDPNTYLYENAIYIGGKLVAALGNEKRDIGDGLFLDEAGKIIVKGTGVRESLEANYTKALMTLPVEGASSEQWAKNVLAIAKSYRMGQKPDFCASPTTIVTTPDVEASPSPSASPSPGGEATPPTVTAPPAGFKPFTVQPSRAYDGASSPAANAVTVTPEKLINVAKVSAVARELFPDEAQYQRAMTIAVITMLVETGLSNPASRAVPESLDFPHDAVFAGDHTSVGIFQQLAHTTYYGSVEQLMDPAYQAYMFFGAPKPLHGPVPADYSKRGLLFYGTPKSEASRTGNWMVDSPGEVVANIQNPAKQYRYRYELWVPAAAEVIKAATGISVDIGNPGGCIASGDSIVGAGGGSMGVKPASGQVLSPIPTGETGILMTAKYGHYPKGGKHFGVDLAKRAGWQVQSICDGTIKAIKINPRYANVNAQGVTGSTNYIWVDCGNGVLIGYAHFYAKDLNSDLKVGMQIGAGTPLFPQGNQGNSSGGHLHLQISTSNSMSYSRDATVDPAAYLAQFGIKLPNPGY